MADLARMSGVLHAPERPRHRRPLTHHSASLRHSSKADSMPGQSPGAPSSHRPKLEGNNRNSSSETNAETWFEASNQHVFPHKQNTDPPFFLEQEAEAPLLSTEPSNRRALPFRSSLQSAVSPNDTSEEYRSIIDDLTVENRDLKRRLLKYERSHSTQLKDDRLFEVRVHGLSSSKKQDLEEALRNFASSINSPSPVEERNSARHHSEVRVRHSSRKPAASMISASFEDSGYGSLTASHQYSVSGSGRSSVRSPAANFTPPARNLDRNVHSYLEDIPEDLVPLHSIHMTEEDKKMLVVRRLEQIFGGRGAERGLHQQPVQQQRVAKSAARDDVSALRVQGRRAEAEGIREARIMTVGTEVAMNPELMSDAPKTQYGVSSELEVEHHTNKDGFTPSLSSPDQRPTRPLDLDPDRAQVPAENIRYLRHLGFFGRYAGDEALRSAEGDWIYLNLLTNIAQLHTMNVTPTLIQNALKQYSQNLEVSEDGRRVRWKPTTVQGRGNVSIATEYFDEEEVTHLPDSSRHGRGCSTDLDDVARSDASTIDTDSNSQQLSLDMVTGTSTAAPEFQSSASLEQQSGDGPLIFYNNATFCTDLSGATSLSISPPKAVDYDAPTLHPLGVIMDQDSHESSVFDIGRGRATVSLQPLSSSPAAQVATMDFEWSEDMSQGHVTLAEPIEHIEFEASGIGGVEPADNFALLVSRQMEKAPSAAEHELKGLLRHHVSPNVAAILACKPPRRSLGHVTHHYSSCRSTALAPSALPPPSMHPCDDSDQESVSSESASEASTAPISERQQHHVHRLALSRTSPSDDPIPPTVTGRGVTESSCDGDGGSSDDEIDFLATARQVAPDEIRALERALDAEMDSSEDGWSEACSAGGSAATAGEDMESDD